MKNTFRLNVNNTTYEVYIKLGEYESNNALAVNLIDAETNEMLDILSVNLPNSSYFLEDNQFFLDTNNCPYAAKFLIENQIAKPTNDSCNSGYCRYPIYELINKEL